MTQLQLQLACLGGLVAATLWLWWRGTDATEWREQQKIYQQKRDDDGTNPQDLG